MKKPIIGLTPLIDQDKNWVWMLPAYLDVIKQVGGIPMILPCIEEPPDVQQLANCIDGLLIPGGQDVQPSLYGEQPLEQTDKPCTERDSFELLLLKEFLKTDKPIFGICRGSQIINVSLGGRLYQDLPTQKPSKTIKSHNQECPYSKTVHTIAVEPNSLLYQSVGVETLSVNSLHHQGISTLAKPLAVAGRADDGLIESYYHPGKPFLLGVQWHPEFLFRDYPEQLALFQKFVEACSKLKS